MTPDWTMNPKRRVTVTLPPAVADAVDRIRLTERRSRSAVVCEALQAYLAVRAPSKAEAAAIRRGRAQIQEGEYVEFDQLLNRLAFAGRETGPSLP